MHNHGTLADTGCEASGIVANTAARIGAIRVDADGSIHDFYLRQRECSLVWQDSLHGVLAIFLGASQHLRGLLGAIWLFAIPASVNSDQLFYFL